MVGGGGVGATGGGAVGVTGGGATVVGTTVVAGGAGGGGWEVDGGGRCALGVEVVGADSVFSVEASDSDFSELLASAAARVKSLENGDQTIGLLGSGNDPASPSRSTTTLMKSAQIWAGNVPPATAMPCTLVR